MPIEFKTYEIPTYDEVMSRANRARNHAIPLLRTLREFDDEDLETRQSAADMAIKEMGITFTVYTGVPPSTAPGRSISFHASFPRASGMSSRPD